MHTISQCNKNVNNVINLTKKASFCSNIEQLSTIQLSETDSEALNAAIALVAPHHKTGRSNPRYYAFKFISRSLMKEDGWCRISLKNMGALMRQTGYSKNLGERQIRRITKELSDSQLILRYRDPKNDRYTYELTQLGFYLFCYLNADKRQFPTILIHRAEQLKNPPDKKCPLQISKNVRSDSLYIKKGNIKVNKDIYENSIVQNLNSCQPGARFYHSLTEMGLSRGSANWLCSWMLQEGVDFETFDMARRIFLYKLNQGKVTSKCAYFKKVLEYCKAKVESDRLELKANLEKQTEIEGAKKLMASISPPEPIREVSIQEKAHALTIEKLSNAALSDSQKQELYPIYYEQMIAKLQRPH